MITLMFDVLIFFIIKINAYRITSWPESLRIIYILFPEKFKAKIDTHFLF